VETESAFIAVTDRVLAAIGAALDVAIEQGDSDADWSIHEGILTIDCGDGGKVIVNRHLPNREIWVAAKSGGFHFRAEGGLWRDTRGGRELANALASIVAEQAGLALVPPVLRAG
jgi:CyaY protein